MKYLENKLNHIIVEKNQSKLSVTTIDLAFSFIHFYV